MVVSREHEVLVETRRERDRLDAEVRELHGRCGELETELGRGRAEIAHLKAKLSTAEGDATARLQELGFVRAQIVEHARKLFESWLADEAREDDNPQPLDDDLNAFFAFVERHTGQTVKRGRE